ncbi:MAG: hypothetical protein K2P45_03440 [Eubacterium sp.]|nr:hypothetical protein [Eubacterium sp.]
MEILRSRFSKNIKDYLEQCIIGFDEYELLNYFAPSLDAAILVNAGEMEVEDFSVEGENGVQNVEGHFRIQVTIAGYEKTEEKGRYILYGFSDAQLIIAFSFVADQNTYSDLKLEYQCGFILEGI